jgi:hypothetical protein
MEIMKKILSILLASLMIVCVFAGCSNSDAQDTAVEITTDSAKIKNNDAIHYIEDSYTVEELGLADVTEDYSFMVVSDGFEYNGEYYIKVVANIVTQNEGVTAEDGSKTFSMKTVGEYLISYDATKVLMKNMDTEEYSELENRTADYSAKGETVASTETE